MYSIIIPTFNNLDYLKLCLMSIKKNSKYEHQIIIHINQGNDGTIQYVKNNKFLHSFSEINKGVCTAFNEGAKKATNKYLVLAHDDMYFCPNWDSVFLNEIKNIKETNFFLSGAMIQPFNGHINFDCGKNFKDFNENLLLENYNKIKIKNFQGTHWQPSLIPKKTWNSVSGFSEEFSPGLGSDPDFNMKLWKIGVRLFKGLSECRVYHFSSITLRKKSWNNGAKTFLKKWGITIKFFRKYYLRTHKNFDGPLTEPKKNVIYYFNLTKCKINLFYISIYGYLFSR